MKLSKEQIDAHLKECPHGDGCPLRLAREILDRPTPPTREEMFDILIRVSFAEDLVREYATESETKAQWIAALLDRHPEGEALLTEAEIIRQKDALVVVSPEDGGTLLKLDDSTRSRSHTVH